MSNSTSEVEISPNGFLPLRHINPELSAQPYNSKYDQKISKNIRILTWNNLGVKQTSEPNIFKTSERNLGQLSRPTIGTQQQELKFAYLLTDKIEISYSEANTTSELKSSAIIVSLHLAHQQIIEKIILSTSLNNISGVELSRLIVPPSAHDDGYSSMPLMKQEDYVGIQDVSHKFRLRKKINDFRLFGPNWDGDDAKEIPSGAITAALKFLDLTGQHIKEHEPRNVSASPDGEIVMYWKSPTVYAEVNFKDSDSIILCWKEGDTDVKLIEEDSKIALNSERIDQSIVWEKLKNLLQRCT